MNHKEFSGRLARESPSLSGYNFTIEQSKDSDQIVPDALFRCIEDVYELEINIELELSSTEFDSMYFNNLRENVAQNTEKIA